MGFPRLIKFFATGVAVLGLALPGNCQPSPGTVPTTTLQNDFEVTGNMWCDSNLTVSGTTTQTGQQTFTVAPIAPGYVLTDATTHKVTLQEPSTLAANRILNIPLLTATSTIDVLELAQTISAVKTFSAVPIFPAGGASFLGTSFNDTVKALAAQGQASTLTIDDVGGATGYIYTMTAAQAAAGVLSRADMVTETNVVINKGILHLKNLDGSTLGTSASAGKFGLSTTATFGSPAQLSLVTEAANNNTKTDACEFEVLLPPDYVAGSAINVVIGQAITIGGGTLSTKSLTVDAFLVADDGTVGSNLGPAAQNMTTTQGNLTFAITPTNLVAGNKLLIQLQTILTETMSSNVTANLTSVAVKTSVKM